MLSTRYKAAKFAIYVLVLLALTVMQNTPGLFAIMNIKPMLAAAMAISIAMFEGELAGGFMGAFAGFCCDLFSSCSFGYYTLTLFFFCVTIGLLVQSYMRPVVANAILFTFITMAVIQWIGFFFSFLLWGYEGAGRYYLYRLLPMCIYTAVSAAPLYYLTRMIHGTFQKKILAA